MVYMAASAAVIRDQHARVELVDLVLPPRVLRRLNLALKTLWGLFSGYITWSSVSLVEKTFSMNQTSPTLGIAMGYIYLIF